MSKDEETKVVSTKTTEEATASAEKITDIKTDDDITEIVITPEEEKVDNVIELSRKYRFEGEIIDKIDLSGIENVSGEKAQEIDKLYRKITQMPSASPELTPDYAMATASILTGLPAEFFKNISFKDITKMKNRIVNFLYGA